MTSLVLEFSLYIYFAIALSGLVMAILFLRWIFGPKDPLARFPTPKKLSPPAWEQAQELLAKMTQALNQAPAAKRPPLANDVELMHRTLEEIQQRGSQFHELYHRLCAERLEAWNHLHQIVAHMPALRKFFGKNGDPSYRQARQIYYELEQRIQEELAHLRFAGDLFWKELKQRGVIQRHLYLLEGNASNLSGNSSAEKAELSNDLPATPGLVSQANTRAPNALTTNEEASPEQSIPVSNKVRPSKTPKHKSDSESSSLPEDSVSGLTSRIQSAQKAPSRPSTGQPLEGFSSPVATEVSASSLQAGKFKPAEKTAIAPPLDSSKVLVSTAAMRALREIHQVDFPQIGLNPKNCHYLDPTFTLEFEPTGILRYYNFENSVFREVQFLGWQRYESCNFRGIDLQKSRWPRAEQPHRFEDCEFDQANLKLCSFRYTAFYRCSFQNADWRGIRLKNVKFVHCQLEGIHWEGVDLSQVAMSKDMLETLDFSSCAAWPKNHPNRETASASPASPETVEPPASLPAEVPAVATEPEEVQPLPFA